jgi:predicted RNA methylase
MLNDYDRNQAYRAAIRRAAPGRVVYDLGAGCGPMSYYALRAGAERVYGFEVDRDVYPDLRRLAARFPNFVPVSGDALRAALPASPPGVVVCEMWSAWLTDWPMVQVLARVRRRAPRARMIPIRGHHVLQLVQARHRAGLPIAFPAGSEASLYGEPLAIAEMSLPVLVRVTDFTTPVAPLDAVVTVRPLASGAVNAVRLFSYEEVSPGWMLPRTGTRTDALLRWLGPLEVRRGRPVRLHVRHRWNTALRITAV